MKKKLLPLALMLAFALSRIPGMLPQNFSAAYALAFCAGVFFTGSMAWWLPLGTLLITDILLNVLYYHFPPFSSYMLLTLATFAGIVGIGRCFKPRMSLLKLVCGGVLGSILFYFISNTASWFFDPGYAKTLTGWIQALTTGRPDFHPTTWEFFRNTLLSGGLFTALFAGAIKLMSPAESPADKQAGARDEKPEAESEPEEAKA